MGRPLKEDLTGRYIGRLWVLERAPSRNGQAMWKCQCICGSIVARSGSGLRRGSVLSCGCWRRAAPTITKRTHGLAHTRVYRIWNGMIQRCHNPNQPHYERYGGRGVAVCERWRNSFEAFLEDMGQPPSDKHSIDRIDNDLRPGYQPGNCRWATVKEQHANRKDQEYKRGEDHHSARFTEQDIRDIRMSTLGLKALADAYGTNPKTIWTIRQRKTWKHVL